MKKWITFFLAMFLLVPTALAAEEEFPYRTSDWAREEVGRAVELDLIYDPYDYFSFIQDAISREDFACNAAALVAKGFGVDLEGYTLVMNYRRQAESEKPIYASVDVAVDAAIDLGILQGTGEGELELDRTITRQEAAAMLSRTYRAYQSAEPDVLEPVTFTDQEDIADWALEDVALMSQLGIMNGVGDGRFDPLGTYTEEQCFISLLRLYEMVPFDGAGQENPFSTLEPQPGFLCTDQLPPSAPSHFFPQTGHIFWEFLLPKPNFSVLLPSYFSDPLSAQLLPAAARIKTARSSPLKTPRSGPYPAEPQPYGPRAPLQIFFYMP